MNFYKREFVNGVLRIHTRQSYRLLRATATGLIRSDVLLAFLNRSRVGIAAPIEYLPHDLLTTDEATEAYGITKSDLRRWTHRKRRPLPHYRLNKSTIRYSKELLGEWLKENSI